LIFFETIKIKNGVIKNLSYHQKRVNYTVSRFFKSKPFSIKKALLKHPKRGVLKTKIIYNKKILKIETTPYKPEKKTKPDFIDTDIEYKYKFFQREFFKENTIFVKNKYITDHTIANIAFFDGKNWLSPVVPLLKGTTRARLLDGGVLKLSSIKKDDIKKFKKIALLNALKGFCIMEKKNDYSKFVKP
jgi:4-amino-4-deoxychorismate lyase